MTLDPRLRALLDDSLAALERRPRKPPRRKPARRRRQPPAVAKQVIRRSAAETSSYAAAAPPPKPRAQRHCGICREPGHRRETCPQRVAELVAMVAPPALETPPTVEEAAPPPEEPAAADDEADDVPDVPLVMVKLRAKAAVTIGGRTRGRSLANHHLTRDEIRLSVEYPSDVERPVTRGDCKDQPRPCPWVSCRHHLYLDVNPDTGSIKFNYPHLEPDEMAVSCSLDVADRGGLVLEEVGAILNLTRERIRQVEVRGLERMQEVAGGEDLHLPDPAPITNLAAAQHL